MSHSPTRARAGPQPQQGNLWGHWDPQEGMWGSTGNRCDAIRNLVKVMGLRVVGRGKATDLYGTLEPLQGHVLCLRGGERREV